MARKRTISYKTKEGKQLKELRQFKFTQIEQIIDYFEKKQSELNEKEKFAKILEDVAKGLYEENDKLFKKSPVETITPLTLEQVNEVIKDTKNIADTDIYVQKLVPFVPAGDNPEVRDVVSVLNQILRGLSRFKDNIKPFQADFVSKLEEANLIYQCLEEFLENDLELNSEDTILASKFSSWFDDYAEEEEEDEDGEVDVYEYHYFNFSKLDKLDIFKQFDYVERNSN